MGNFAAKNWSLLSKLNFYRRQKLRKKKKNGEKFPKKHNKMF